VNRRHHLVKYRRKGRGIQRLPLALRGRFGGMLRGKFAAADHFERRRDFPWVLIQQGEIPHIKRRGARRHLRHRLKRAAADDDTAVTPRQPCHRFR